MVGGRLQVRGGLAWGELKSEVNLDTLIDYQTDRAPKLGPQEKLNLNLKVRDTVNIYRLAHRGSKGTGTKTRTEVVKAVKKVQKNAKNVVRTGGQTETWLIRLADSLRGDVNLLSDLHYHIIREDVDIFNLQHRIDSQMITQTDLENIDKLSKIVPNEIVPSRHHPNPPLQRLVSELIPIWENVTGSSAYPRNNLEGDKYCPFAEWLKLIVHLAGMKLPGETTILKLVQIKKRKKSSTPARL